MELWIRVQKNKQLNQGLVKVEDLILEKYSANEWSIRQSCDTLAIYKTEERALEVLDEIEKLIKPITIFQNYQVDKSTIEKIKETSYCMVNNDARVEQISQVFYQMPEK